MLLRHLYLIASWLVKPSLNIRKLSRQGQKLSVLLHHYCPRAGSLITMLLFVRSSVFGIHDCRFGMHGCRPIKYVGQLTCAMLLKERVAYFVNISTLWSIRKNYYNYSENLGIFTPNIHNSIYLMGTRYTGMLLGISPQLIASSTSWRLMALLITTIT